MPAIIARRLGLGLLTMFAVTVVTFALVHLAPGEPFSRALEDPRVTPAARAVFRERYGLDRPLPVQFTSWAMAVARGDLGESLSQGRPVASVLGEALPRTLLLMGTALVAGFALGIVLGAWQALRRGRLADRAIGAVTVAIGAVPDFWIALGLAVLFAHTLRWFPTGGVIDPALHDYMSAAGRAADVARHLVLPATALTLLVAAQAARHQRAALVDVLPEDWVRTARAKGLAERSVLLRHALRNALLPTVTLFGLALPALAGGAVFVEATFSWPGLGGIAVGAIAARDYPLILGSTLLASALVVAGGVLADLLHAATDPRLRRG